MASSKYEVVSQTLEVLLSPGTAQFEVPPFQRTYSWGTDEINQLIDDIYGDSPDLPSSELPYFLGSIVLAAKEDTSVHGPDQILDGQQRLTTLSLMIAVLVHRLNEGGAQDAGDYRTYLLSRRVRGQSKPKVLLQSEDRRAYESLVREPSSYNDSKFKDTSIGIALAIINRAIDRYIGQVSPQTAVNDLYAAMLERLLYDVEIVRIIAPSENDAFRLFETLNDRGLALSAADLIKNKLFSRCGPEIDDATDAWSNVVSYTRDDDIVDFLRYFWIAFHGFVRKRGLYEKYKNHINTLEATEAGLFAIDLDETAKIYEQVVNPRPKTLLWGQEVANAMERLNTFRARGCRPAILACGRFRPDDVAKIVHLCESITVRYSIVGEKSTNRLEVIYSEICRALRQSTAPLEQIFTAEPLLQFLSEVPNDEEFIARLETLEILSVTPTWREILSLINSALGTGETRVERSGRVHVDHILPQNPRATVLTESGVSMDEAMRLVPRIGNLTLLSGRKNREASNKPFSSKRESYAASEIAMTKELAAFSKWGKEQIENRSREFAELLAKIYPHPVDIVRQRVTQGLNVQE
jgi:hypothetical protein